MKKTDLQDGAFDLIISSATVDGVVSSISTSIGKNSSRDSLTVSNNVNIYGTLSGCVIAPVDSSITPMSLKNYFVGTMKVYLNFCVFWRGDVVAYL